jgi:predicted ester cyclase
MSTEQNKTHANQFVEEVINAGQVERATAFFVTDYVDHAPVPPGFPTGVAGLQQYFTLFRAAFPDLHYTVDDTVAEGDKVVQRVTGHGTMHGEFLGMLPTGKPATWTEIHITRAGPDGKFVEHWANVDQVSMLQQLGVIPTPEQAPG